MIFTLSKAVISFEASLICAHDAVRTLVCFVSAPKKSTLILLSRMVLRLDSYTLTRRADNTPRTTPSVEKDRRASQLVCDGTSFVIATGNRSGFTSSPSQERSPKHMKEIQTRPESFMLLLSP